MKTTLERYNTDKDENLKNEEDYWMKTTSNYKESLKNEDGPQNKDDVWQKMSKFQSMKYLDVCHSLSLHYYQVG